MFLLELLKFVLKGFYLGLIGLVALHVLGSKLVAEAVHLIEDTLFLCVVASPYDRCALESHVLEEMGQTCLPFPLVHTPDFDHDHTSEGRDLGALIDEEAHAVREGELLDLVREALGVGGCEGKGKKKQAESKKSESSAVSGKSLFSHHPSF
ncbi:MAG: hypothetical protein OEW23_03935 [Candidatus Aminicenantes bacterium]|nr:hypothetical protein [Candidatus Aminicenantes bacterium]